MSERPGVRIAIERMASQLREGNPLMTVNESYRIARIAANRVEHGSNQPYVQRKEIRK